MNASNLATQINALSQHTDRATKTEQGLPADAQVLVEVTVLEVVVLGEGEQGDAGGVPRGDQGDALAEAEPREIHRDPGRQPGPSQDGVWGEGRDAPPQVGSLFLHAFTNMRDKSLEICNTALRAIKSRSFGQIVPTPQLSLLNAFRGLSSNLMH